MPTSVELRSEFQHDGGLQILEIIVVTHEVAQVDYCNGTLTGKPFKILHSDPHSRDLAVAKIKEALPKRFHQPQGRLPGRERQ